FDEEGLLATFSSVGTSDEGPQITPSRPIEGTTIFIGRACDTASIPPATATATVAVAERGDCNFQVKVENANAAGYKNVIIMNIPDAASSPCENVIGMDFDGYAGDAVSVLVSRAVGMAMLGLYNPATYTCAQPAPDIA